MKLHENPKKIRHFDFLQFSSIFMTPGTWKSTKTRCFDFLQLSWPYMKIHKNQTLRFSLTFMTLGAWKSTKIRCFDFLQLSWPRVHENPQKPDTLIFFNFYGPGYMKIHKNQTLWFSLIFMYPGSWKLKKIEASGFCGFACTRGHKN